MTPGLFDALISRKEAADKSEFCRAGIVAAAVINHSFSPPDKAVSPLDFVPGIKKSDGVDISGMSPEEQAIAVKNMFRKKKFRRRS